MLPATVWEVWFAAYIPPEDLRLRSGWFDMSQMVFCEEGRRLKQQYESALHGWQLSAFLPQSQPGGEATGEEAIRLREAALAERNAAADRMYLHRSHCAFCRRQR